MADTREDLITPDLIPKVTHAGSDFVGQPFILQTDSLIAISAGDGLDIGITVDSDFGLNLQGPIHMQASPEDISIGGGYWRINPLVTACYGSSAALPVPWLVEDTPDLLQSQNDISDVVSALGA